MLSKIINKPLLIYDANCRFCLTWVDYLQKITEDQVEYKAFQEVAGQFPEISLKDFRKSIQLILPTGEIVKGAEAVFMALSVNPKKRYLLWLYKKIPGLDFVLEKGYIFIATHRTFAYKLTRILWGKIISPSSYDLVRWLFLRILGLVYFIAFASFGIQALGLIGSGGILPLEGFLDAVKAQFGVRSYWILHTVFWLGSSNGFITLISILGAVVALFLMFGFLKRTATVVLFIGYLSLVSAGQVFMSFQWDILLLEVGFLAIFLSFFRSHVIIWLFRWLVFRFVFFSGVVKLLSGDPTWRNLTALTFHYETQPLPNVFGWYIHQLPVWFHQLSVGVTFFIQLAVIFLVFAPRRARFVAAFSIIFLEGLIFLTGNYTFFNILTVALALFLLDDKALSHLMPKRIYSKIKSLVKPKEASSLARKVVSGFAALVIIISGSLMIGVFSGKVPKPASYLVNIISPFRIVNTYGLFATMTTIRNEIVIEGSNDGERWLSYKFKYKPGDPSLRPKWNTPHQPRLDWQMWFAALGPYEASPWISSFMSRILQGSPEVLALLQENPFPNDPPRFLRALFYEYHFTNFEGLRQGDWWTRELKGLYFPVVSLTPSS